MSYSPTLGRFLQRDPLGYADGTALYEYQGAAPVSRTDAAGETWGENPGIMWNWFWEKGAMVPPSAGSVSDMKQSEAIQNMLATYKAAGCPQTPFPLSESTPDAFFDSLKDPLNGTVVQLGGFNVTITPVPGGNITITITNYLNPNSLLYHVFSGPGGALNNIGGWTGYAPISSFGTWYTNLGTKPQGGTIPLMGNQKQVISWTQPSPCSGPNTPTPTVTASWLSTQVNNCKAGANWLGGKGKSVLDKLKGWFW